MTESCPECGFDWETKIPDGIRTLAQLPNRASSIVDSMGELAYRKRQPDAWSASEYIWHLGDTLRMGAEWLHDIRTQDHPTHYAPDNDLIASGRQYRHLSAGTGLWSLDAACRLFTEEAARADPTRTCYYHDWRDVTAAQVMGFMFHEAVHHLFDLERLAVHEEVQHAR